MFVIPMAGQSSRFLKAGYNKPKYKLLIKDNPLFDYCIKSFKKYFIDEKFLFILRDELDRSYVCDRCDFLGVNNYEVVVIESQTRGQAETVYLGLAELEGKVSEDESLFVFNIDTIRPDFIIPKIAYKCDGYLEVFKGEGEAWSFVELIEGSDKVCRTTEKIRISELCSTGMYYFKEISVFMRLFECVSTQNPEELQGGEFYIAPMYNVLIDSEKDIRCFEIDPSEVIFCGVPSEYESILKNTSILIGV